MGMDKSTGVGGRVKSAGSKTGPNNTAGNSYQEKTPARSFASSRTQSVAKQNTRFKKTRTRRGEKNAVS